MTFVIGGITRSELRVAHALSARFGRDITIGGTSVETPATFLQHVQVLHQHTCINPMWSEERLVEVDQPALQ